jgi:hypothetical protein
MVAMVRLLMSSRFAASGRGWTGLLHRRREHQRIHGPAGSSSHGRGCWWRCVTCSGGAVSPADSYHGVHEEPRRCTEGFRGKRPGSPIGARHDQALRAQRNIAFLRAPPWFFVNSVVEIAEGNTSSPIPNRHSGPARGTSEAVTTEQTARPVPPQPQVKPAWTRISLMLEAQFNDRFGWSPDVYWLTIKAGQWPEAEWQAPRMLEQEAAIPQPWLGGRSRPNSDLQPARL